MADESKKPKFMTLPWFKPVYRRVILIGIVVAWCAWEWFMGHEQLWQWITLAAVAYAVWSFWINFDKELKKYEDAQPKS